MLFLFFMLSVIAHHQISQATIKTQVLELSVSSWSRFPWPGIHSGPGIGE